VKNTCSLYTVSGKVESNVGRGEKIGYPTANIRLTAKDKNAPEGVFAGYTVLHGKKYPSLIFVGKAETFGEKDKKCESHILDFNQNLYGEEITLELLLKIRENKKFYQVGELIRQIKRDEFVCRGELNL
jgi:riboflavin kinase/FMN adenylyltransferase